MFGATAVRQKRERERRERKDKGIKVINFKFTIFYYLV